MNNNKCNVFTIELIQEPIEKRYKLLRYLIIEYKRDNYLFINLNKHDCFNRKFKTFKQAVFYFTKHFILSDGYDIERFVKDVLIAKNHYHKYYICENEDKYLKEDK